MAPGNSKAAIPAPVVLISSTQHAMRVPRKKLADLVAFVARAQGRRVAQVDLAVVGVAEIVPLPAAAPLI